MDKFYIVQFIINVIMIGIIVYLYLQNKNNKKHEIQTNYIKTATKTVDQLVTKNIELEKKIEKYQRPYVGLILNWEPCREDKAAYLLKIYNDSSETIYNISIEFDSRYTDCSGLFIKRDICEPEKSLNLFFIPGGWTDLNSEESNREKFTKVWVQNNLEPIKFTVKYTKTPLKDNFLTGEINFTTEQLSKHLERKISNHKK